MFMSVLAFTQPDNYKVKIDTYKVIIFPFRLILSLHPSSEMRKEFMRSEEFLGKRAKISRLYLKLKTMKGSKGLFTLCNIIRK